MPSDQSGRQQPAMSEDDLKHEIEALLVRSGLMPLEQHRVILRIALPCGMQHCPGSPDGRHMVDHRLVEGDPGSDDGTLIVNVVCVSCGCPGTICIDDGIGVSWYEDAAPTPLVQ